MITQNNNNNTSRNNDNTNFRKPPASHPYTPRPHVMREPREVFSRSSLTSLSKKPIRVPMRRNKISGPKFETKISEATEIAHIPPLAADSIRIIHLGGVEEVGRNMSCVEFADSIIIVDCGFQFTESSTPGVECILPNTRYLEENKHKIKGMLITHGHLDHIGAIPYILPRIGNPKI